MIDYGPIERGQLAALATLIERAADAAVDLAAAADNGDSVVTQSVLLGSLLKAAGTLFDAAVVPCRDAAVAEDRRQRAAERAAASCGCDGPVSGAFRIEPGPCPEPVGDQVPWEPGYGSPGDAAPPANEYEPDANADNGPE